ncbi:protein FAM166B-like [Rhopalosiphum maidis]|uniref:protein FAM166B-like n=1 Tax=Rhopalosiphum maidis TaxID=43146 RepID=UPI000EFF84A0|nr:protein FAM166B-like [Rhopalosiphum maidis]XP_026804207.1 protein FAM166B-like [Rhopalosiphum maidis]XP_060854242.1 ciliary microtubule inner protein 2B-like [Rhopalosiphum padi]
MVIECNKKEREKLFSQSNGALLPGYTGHCPTLKFRFGKRYGANTLDIIQELREKGVLKQCDLKNMYLRDSPLDELPPKPNINDLKMNIDKEQETVNNYQRYILGYTGYIPGMHFRYGKTFCRLAQECEDNMLVKLSSEQSRKAIDRPVRFLPPKMVPDKANMRLQHTLNKYKRSKDFKDHKVSSELPPIAGYTGHIPRLKVSNISVSLPFHHSAKLGLSVLKQDNGNAVKQYTR